MPEREVCRPVNTRNTGSKLRGNIPGFSPGAKSDPGRVGGPRFDNVQPHPQHRAATHQETPVPSATPVVIGPRIKVMVARTRPWIKARDNPNPWWKVTLLRKELEARFDYYPGEIAAPLVGRCFEPC